MKNPIVFIYISLLCLVLASCRTTKQTIQDMTDVYEWERLTQKVTDYEHVMDSLVKVIMTSEEHKEEREERDSTYSALWQSENLIVQDSVYEKEFADGSKLREVWHNATRSLVLRDTVYRDRVSYEYLSDLYSQYEATDRLRDRCLFLEDSIACLRDSISSAIHHEVQVMEKKESWLVQLLSIVGAVAILVLVSTVLFRNLFERMD